MERSLNAGRAIFAVALAAMGALVLARSDFPRVLVPVPSALPGRAVLAALLGAWMIAAAVAILIDRSLARGDVAAGHETPA